MSVILPFRAYRPRPEQAREVASFPYDVLSSDEARELARGNPVSFLHVCKPEIDLDPAIDVHDDRVYAKGRENLRRLIADGVLVRDPAPCLYVYQQRMGDHVQAGIVALCSVREYEQDLIKKHEHTRPDKEDDRTRHVTEANANAEPVFLAYRARRDIDRIVDAVCAPPGRLRLHRHRRHRACALGRLRPRGGRRAREALRRDPRALRGRRPPPHGRGRAPRPGSCASRTRAGGGTSRTSPSWPWSSLTTSSRSSTTTAW